MKYLLAVLLLVGSLGAVRAATNDDLFVTAAPSIIPLPEVARSGSGFVTMNRARFERLASGTDFTCTIPHFPLGPDRYADLRVEQFDVVGRSVHGNTAIAEHVFFRGVVEGHEESHVFLALFADHAFGYITEGSTTYSVSGAGRSEDGSLVVGSIVDSTSFENFACGNVSKMETISQSVQQIMQTLRSQPMSGPAAGSVRLLTVALELDHPFVVAHGGKAQTALSYALSVLAAASDIYTRDAGIALQCIYHTEYEDQDPYTAPTACELLDQVTVPTLSPQPTLWVTMSARPTDWCGGIAEGIGVICEAVTSPHCICGTTGTVKSWDYPYRTFVWDIMVTAHETGHLVACPHTHNCYWNPPIDSCVESEGGCYNGTYPSRGTIMSYCHTTPAGAALKFHPLCNELMMQEVDQKSCYQPIELPTARVSPASVYAQCAGGLYPITLTPANRATIASVEVNPRADSIIAIGNAWRVVLNASHYQKFYLRLTDSLGNRSYDSVVFTELPGFTVRMSVDSLSLPDSVVLTADPTTTMGAVNVKWCRVGTSFALHTGPSYTLPRNGMRYYCVATTAGGCAAADTVTLPATRAAVLGAEPVAYIHILRNPAHSVLQISSVPESASCYIVDLLGRPVSSVKYSQGKADLTFDIEDLASGTYYLVYESPESHGSLKFRKE